MCEGRRKKERHHLLCSTAQMLTTSIFSTSAIKLNDDCFLEQTYFDEVSIIITLSILTSSLKIIAARIQNIILCSENHTMT